MSKFQVLMGRDAFAVFAAVIEADSIEQANEFAHADKHADIWTSTGEVRVYDDPTIFDDETDYAAEAYSPKEVTNYPLTPEERNIIIAALRLWIDSVNDGSEYLNEGLIDIATNGGQSAMLDDNAIDLLIQEKLNA